MIHRYKDHRPEVGKVLFISDTAEIAGEVYAEEDVSLWYNVSIRADLAPIYIGRGSNIQDNSVLHVAEDFSCRLGANVTVGHGAILHACTIGDTCLIGMGAIILDGAEIGAESIVGAGSLVTQHKSFPPGSLIIGSPAKVLRRLTDKEIEGIRKNALEYIELAREYGRQSGEAPRGISP